MTSPPSTGHFSNSTSSSVTSGWFSLSIVSHETFVHDNKLGKPFGEPNLRIGATILESVVMAGSCGTLS